MRIRSYKMSSQGREKGTELQEHVQRLKSSKGEWFQGNRAAGFGRSIANKWREWG